jgi:hypothetical protein
MDFIERLFGVSPDGGDGSTELLWLATLAIGIAMLVFFRVRRRRARAQARRIR